MMSWTAATGTDTAMFGLEFAAYDIAIQDQHVVVVAQSGNEGSDVVTNVEQFDFAGTVYTLADGVLRVAGEPAPPPDLEERELPTTGTVQAPEVPQPDAPNELVGYLFGQAGQSTWTTFGQTFAAGDLHSDAGLVLNFGGTRVPVQLDVKATHEDGSVRHGILSAELPPGGYDREAMLEVVTTTAAAPITAQSLLDNPALDLTLRLDFDDGSVASVSARDALQQSIQSGDLTTWLAGPQVSEFVVRADINPHLQAEFSIRSFDDGTLRTDVIVRNETTYTSGIKTYNYDATILQEGEAVIAHEGIAHHPRANWHEVVWSEPMADVHITRDVDYLIQSGAVPGYDTSIGVDAAQIERFHQDVLAADTGPMGTGTVTQFMGQTGGRPDIGPVTRWGANYLLTQDPRAEATLMANADVAGSIPWHYRDEATGEAVSIDEHPTIWFDSRGSRLADAPESSDGNTDGWRLDTAHQPQLSFLPYLLTGDRYHLENLQAQANHVMASHNPANGFRNGTDGLVDDIQTRGIAWSLRALSDAAWITPDDDAQKDYFSEKLANNMAFFYERNIVEPWLARRARWRVFGGCTAIGTPARRRHGRTIS